MYQFSCAVQLSNWCIVPEQADEGCSQQFMSKEHILKPYYNGRPYHLFGKGI